MTSKVCFAKVVDRQTGKETRFSSPVLNIVVDIQGETVKITDGGTRVSTCTRYAM